MSIAGMYHASTERLHWNYLLHPFENLLEGKRSNQRKGNLVRVISGTEHAGYRKQNIGLHRKFQRFIFGSEKIS